MADHVHSTPTSERRPAAAASGAGRRSLFGAAAALALAPAAALAATASPDAELVAIVAEAVPLIAEYERTIAIWFSLPGGHPDSQFWADAGDAPYDRLEELTDRAAEFRATTLEGFKAKARLLRHHIRVGHRCRDGMLAMDPEVAMAWELVHEMLGEVTV